MSIKEIKGFPVQNFVGNNAHLYLWVTNNYIESGFEVVRAWGFIYKTIVTWGKPSIGLGQYFRGQTEHCLFGVKGNLPYKVIDGKRQQGRTLFLAPRYQHSQKPEEMRRMIERVSYPPFLELFARHPSPGWDVMGNEISDEKFLF